jgi:hypothetical protein
MHNDNRPNSGLKSYQVHANHLKVVPVVNAMKAYGGVDVYTHVFLTSTLVGGEWSASRPCRFTPGTHWIGGWVDPRARGN